MFQQSRLQNQQIEAKESKFVPLGLCHTSTLGYLVKLINIKDSIYQANSSLPEQGNSRHFGKWVSPRLGYGEGYLTHYVYFFMLEISCHSCLQSEILPFGGLIEILIASSLYFYSIYNS